MPIAIVMLLALACPQGSTALDPGAYAATRRTAGGLYERRAWAQAVPLYEQLVATFAGDGENWQRLGVGRYYLGDHAGASAAFERSLGLGFGETPRAQHTLACCFARLDERDQAVAALNAALASGWVARGRLVDDADLSSLHDDPRWSELTGAAPTDLERDTGWRFDLDFLVGEARRLHTSPARPAFSQGFADEAAALYAEIPDLSDDQVLLGMIHLIAALDDGHSAIYGPGPANGLEFEGRVLPFKFYLFPDGVYIVDGADDAARFASLRVVRFGAVAAEEVMQRLSDYRGVDNPMTWNWMGPQFYLRRLSMLRAAGVQSGPEGTVELTLADADGVEHVTSVQAGVFELVRKLRPSPEGSGEVPRYLSRVDTNYWMEYLPDHDALYFQFNQVRDDPSEAIAAFAERLRTALSDEAVTALIVDVRHNNGGNNSLVRPLIRALVQFELRSPENRIVVLTGRNTFSAAQNFINRIERWTDALFVGEPSSSSPNFVGEETELVLPFSGVRGSLSTRYWQDSDPGDERVWIAPDLPVELTAEDYFAGRDPALAAVLNFIAGS
jgi:tetratricopeptide (TPR) repeat protein